MSHIWVAGRWVPKLILVVLVPLLLAGGVVATFLVDRSMHEGRVARNVQLDGVPIGGTSLSEVAAALRISADDHAARVFLIELGDVMLRGTAGDYGFTLDVDATLHSIEIVGSTPGLWDALLEWRDRLTTPVTLESVFASDEAVARASVVGEASRLHTAPREPAITFDGESLVLDPGDAGRELDIDATLVAVLASAPLKSVMGIWSQIPTEVAREDSIGLFTALKRHTESGVILFSDGAQEFIDPETFAGWISAETVDGELVVRFAEADMRRTIEEVFFGYVQGDLVVAYDVIDDVPTIVDISDTRTICCAPTSVQRVEAVALGDTDGPVRVPLRIPTADEQSAAVEALGVTEVIGAFTTFHRCCEGRVTNIHRIADLTRGVVIGPGDSFSVNEFVGKRTSDNGFVSGGVIYQGRFESDIGGGISQYATTLFNAAFFGGLDMPTYQSHSLYLDRYPYGREATLSYPAPDLVIHNPTTYAVLLWPTYDATSITVTLYSTLTSVVTQTGQEVDQWRSCTRVTTYRLREYDDGQRLEDAFQALYRPSAGYSCDGLAEPDDSSQSSDG